MDFKKTFQLLDLSPEESRIYRAALEYEHVLPKHLAEQAGIKRSTLYSLLPGLFEKGLLSATIIGKRRYLIAEDPHVYFEKKKEDLRRLEDELPALHSLLSTARIKPKITFYEGVEGIKKLYMESLRERVSLLEFVSLEKISPEIEFHSARYYIPTRINRRIPIKILVSGTTHSARINLKNDPYALREVRILDQKKFPIPLDCYIYGDNVSFAVYRSDSEPTGIIIRSKEIATTLRSLFTYVWEAIGDT